MAKRRKAEEAFAKVVEPMEAKVWNFAGVLAKVVSGGAPAPRIAPAQCFAR